MCSPDKVSWKNCIGIRISFPISPADQAEVPSTTLHMQLDKSVSPQIPIYAYHGLRYVYPQYSDRSPTLSGMTDLKLS
jgi:hypothetical protein